MAQIKVEVELDEFSDNEFIEEVKNRAGKGYKNAGEFLKKLKEEVRQSFEPVTDTVVKSLADQMKYDFFIENFDKISENDLRKIVSK